MRAIWKKTLSITVLLLVIIAFSYPIALPSTKYEGWKRDASNAAQDAADMLLEHPIERLLILRLRVVDIKDKGSVSPPHSCGSSRIRLDHDFEAIVEALTLFGIRMARIVVTCNGAGRLGQLD